MGRFEGSIVDAFLNEVRREAVETNVNQTNRNRNQSGTLNPFRVKENNNADESSEYEDEDFLKILYERYEDDVPFQFTGFLVKLTHVDTEVWSDTSVGKRPCYRLRFLRDFEEIEALGRETFDSLRTSICPRDVGRLMLLAYNIVGPDDIRLFGVVDGALIDYPNCHDIELMDRTPLRSATRVRFSFEATQRGDTYEEIRIRAIGYCYLAASYMRMYTKSAENYIRIGEHLRRRFVKFYAAELPFSSFHPDKQTVDSIKSIMETNETLRNTFYNFLYAGESNQHGKSLKEFLYSMHVTLTGMHAYQLFLKCMTVYKYSNADLIWIFNCPKFDGEIKAITFIFSHLFRRGPGRELQMWRFSRIFDPKYLSALHTKNCVIFTYALAVLYKLGTTKVDGTNVFKIVQFDNISYDAKVTAKIIGKRAKFVLEQLRGCDPAAKQDKFRNKRQRTANAQ